MESELILRAQEHAIHSHDYWCSDCGGRAHVFLCNGIVPLLRPESLDYWAACDSAECMNAYGEDYGQSNTPTWLLRKPQND
jgi:hypothetical protein